MKESQKIHFNGGVSWFTGFNAISRTVGISENNINKRSINRLRQTLKEEFMQKWAETVDRQNKMVTYKKVKTGFHYENYLTIVKNKDHRQSMTRMRTSAHRLMIEKGRHLKIPREDRLCPKCSMNVVEDEQHVLIECPAYNERRQTALDKISEMCPNFTRLNSHDQMTFLLSAEGESSIIVAEFCHNILADR